MKGTLIGLIALLLLAGCSDEGIPGEDALFKQVQNHRVGSDADQWIEIRNSAGEWERTGLIFGYLDDYRECVKAIEGLKKANEDREYRCTPAN